MVTNRIIFFATSVQPNPEEIDYWVDLSDNPYGGSIKYFNGTEWVRLSASGGIPDLSNYYTKTQVNNLLNNKADVGDVDSKVDDEEVKDVIKDIQFNTSNSNDITMVMFKYDGSNKTISLPVASISSAGIVTSKDFLDFVKQHQLQELHTEMIDTFADVRAKYQKKLIPGLNIEIDQDTNVISASGDLAADWDNILHKPDFKPVATSGDYNDLTNKLKPGKDVNISDDNVITIDIDSDELNTSLSALNSKIVKEAETARAAETELSNAITTEKNRAESAENTISTSLSNEISRSTEIDTQHTNAINKEIQDRKDAITTEVNDRNAAIQNEINRATGVESTLSADVELISKTKVDKVIGKQLSTEDYTTEEKTKLSGIDDNANNYTLPAATTTILGGIIVGDRLSIDSTGKLVATYTYTLPTASSSVLGGVKTGSNITNTDGTISLTKANVTSALGVDPTTTYVKKTGDTMTGILNIKNSEGVQLELFSTASDGGAYMRFYPNNQTDNKWYLGVGTDQTVNIGYNAVTKASFGDGQLSLNTSTNLAPIKTNSTTLCTNLNADMIDGYDVAEGDKTGIYYTKFYGVGANNTDWLRLATLPLVSQNTTSAKYVIFEIVGGGNFGSNQYNYSTLVASTRDKECVKLVKQQSNTQLSGDAVIAGYVVTSTNVEIWLGFTGTYRSSISITCKNKQLANDVLTSSFVTTKPDNFVLGEIVTLDAPDWYGVSWSETSSSPDCTRIGNMDMHRTLPIQNMMKGYIYFKDGNPLYRMLKLNDSWTKCESYSAGGWRDVGTLLEDNNVNVMIKIPEFWWIDDYIESTETHNLKICPHAKPGWHHHKEAYVSAYEGYIDGDYYRSSKNKIPSVNFTRSTVRPKARANGLGNSWNIYTYNEHRAICHLFLVEYATRNSQKTVNTALTVEGFRQGGLGSGCTTGAVTINGATTYSFIPTGSSDSLGSGSGEVTVTIQQTDSSSSNTTTTTRKCNRYRGIENPFGHVWKHTDDVISIYISGYGARFWHKCDSPDHFGDTISNSYYKNIAANAVVTGYKTKIVTTSTCDFFVLSCNNGSETTYWCDYNWDNTDGSLHCLLIGGRSVSGGAAGLFYLSSGNSVGGSGADIGSRLTYLPWAE